MALLKGTGFTCFFLASAVLPEVFRILYISPHPGTLSFIDLQYPDADVVAGFKRVSGSYVPPGPMFDIDVTDIKFPDAFFDLVICEHVLEHVQNDRLALAEIRRVLSRKGTALLQVPFSSPNQTTLENVAGVRTDDDRKRVYGQRDHVRRYGTDFFERVQGAGFKVRRIVFSEWFRQRLNSTTLIEAEMHQRGMAALSIKE